MAKKKNAKVERFDDDDEEDLIGHNEGPSMDEDEDENPRDVGGVAGQRLLSIIERVERLEEEKQAIVEDIKEIWTEAKGAGFCTKTAKKILKIRKMDREKRREEDEMLSLYMAALGMEVL